MTIRRSTLERNNVTLHGRGDKVVLYGHGFGCNQTMWNRVTPAFASTYRQVLFDYVGSDHSDWGAFTSAKYATLQGYVQDLLDVCDALNLSEGVTFVGHSVSCSIGLLASIQRPSLFERMVLVGPNPCFLNHPPQYLGGFEREDLDGLLLLMEQNYIGWTNYLAPIVSGQGPTERVTKELNTSFCTTDPVLANAFARTTFFSDNRADLPRVACPCLVLQHRYDTLAPLSVGEYVHANLKGSTLKVLDVAGHCAHMSHPAMVIDAMREFLGRPLHEND